MTFNTALFLSGFPFIVCGCLGLGMENKNAFELFLFSAEIIAGICLIYFAK